MRPFVIGLAAAAALGVAMFVVLTSANVSQVERYDSVAVHPGPQSGGHVIIER